jgi:hypothetical protein
VVEQVEKKGSVAISFCRRASALPPLGLKRQEAASNDVYVCERDYVNARVLDCVQLVDVMTIKNNIEIIEPECRL